MRLWAGSLVAVTVALSAAGSSAGQTHEPPTQRMVLRLHDLPPGFRVGDDSGCGSPETEGSIPEIDEWAAAYRVFGCSFEYERLFAPPGPGVVPPLVEGEVLEAGDSRGAEAGLRIAGALARERTGSDAAPAEVAAPPIGEDARLFRSRELGIEGRARGNGSLLYWRDGSLLAVLLVAGGAPEINDRVAARLAAVQQRRIESPTPYAEAERDDTLVPLDNPHLKLPIYWLGTTFAPDGGLPPSVLAGASVALRGDLGPPGEKIELQYSEGPQLGIWTKTGWKQRRGTLFNRINWTGSCSPPARTALDGGSSVIYAVHLRRTRPSEFGGLPRPPKPCPGARPNHYFAIVHREKVVIGVDLAVCYTCAEPHEGPYDSLRGMKAIVNSLRIRHRLAS